WVEGRLLGLPALSPTGPCCTGTAGLHTSRRLDRAVEGRREHRARRTRPAAPAEARRHHRRRGSLRYLRALEAAGAAAHRLGARSRRRGAAEYPPVHDRRDPPRAAEGYLLEEG